MRFRKGQMYLVLLPLDNHNLENISNYQIIQVSYIECVMNKKYYNVRILSIVKENPLGHKVGDILLVNRNSIFKTEKEAKSNYEQVLGLNYEKTKE